MQSGNVARNSLEGAEDKVKTVIKNPLHSTGLGSFGGARGTQLVLSLSREDEQITGVLLVHLC